MQHSKVFKRTDGSSARITVRLGTSLDIGFKYSFSVEQRGPKKVKWMPVFGQDDWAYRKLDLTQRKQYRQEKCLELVTEAEIQEVCEELWQAIKPVIIFSE